MYPVLSCYQVVSPDHVHLLPMNMTALMVMLGILRVKKKENVCPSQAITIDSRSKLQQFSDWLKTCPSARDNKTASGDVFSRVSFEKAARIVNGFLERQSDCSIPSLLYRAGLTVVTKMQGQDFPGLCLLTILSMGGMMGPQYVELERDFTLLLWLGISMNNNLSQKVYTDDCLSILSECTVFLVSYCD